MRHRDRIFGIKHLTGYGWLLARVNKCAVLQQAAVAPCPREQMRVGSSVNRPFIRIIRREMKGAGYVRGNWGC